MKPVLIAIVKDEEKNIIRCLESVSHLFDRFVINYSGTTDKTVEVGSDWVSENGKSGIWIEPEWKGAGDALNHCIEKAAELGEWCLRIDADMVGEGTLPEILKLDSDITAIDIPIHRTDGSFISNRPFCFRIRDSKYRGVRHEGLWTTKRHKQTDFKYYHHDDSGARPRDASTYTDDYMAMWNELPSQIDDDLVQRYVFYMANSARDAGDLFTAAVWFRIRQMMGGYEDEISISAREHALILNEPDFFIKALARHPERADLVWWALAVRTQFGGAYTATVCSIAQPDKWEYGLMFQQHESLWNAGYQMIIALTELGRFDEAKKLAGRVRDFDGADLDALSSAIPGWDE